MGVRIFDTLGVKTLTFFVLLGDWSNSFLLQCRDQLELDKKFVLSHLEREFGTGWSHKRVLQDMARLLRHRRDNARLVPPTRERFDLILYLRPRGAKMTHGTRKTRSKLPFRG